MKYTVNVDEYYNQEFDFWLYDGEMIGDGDLESDLVAQLVASGVLLPDGMTQDEPETED